MLPILHPVPMSAAALMAVNDHVLKHAGVLPGWFTGKLSDVLGLFFFPMLLVSLARALGVERRDGRVAVAMAAATGIVFTWINVSPGPSEWLAPWCHVTPDLTDLLTLPMLGVSVWWMRRVGGAPRVRAPLRAAAVAAAAMASLATSAMPPPPYVTTRDYPIWRPAAPAHLELDACGALDAWVSKSGKSGVGVTVRVSHLCERPRAARVLEVSLVMDGEVAAGELPGEALALTPHASRHAYVPLPFDNERAWNQGVRRGELVVAVDVGAGRQQLRVPMTHELRGALRRYPNPAAEGYTVPSTPSTLDPPGGETRDYMR
jgi:hypothetical protein